jgi:hypothetical protein
MLRKRFDLFHSHLRQSHRRKGDVETMNALEKPSRVTLAVTRDLFVPLDDLERRSELSDNLLGGRKRSARRRNRRSGGTHMVLKDSLEVLDALDVEEEKCLVALLQPEDDVALNFDRDTSRRRREEEAVEALRRKE